MSSPWKMLPSVSPTSASSSRGVRISAWRTRSRKPGAYCSIWSRQVSPKASRSASVHSPALELRRGVLHEDAHEVLARRGHRRVDQGRDHDVEEGVARPAAGLPVVVGAFHPLDRVGEMEVALEAGRAFGERREARQAVEGDVELAGGAAGLEGAHPLQEWLGQLLVLDAGKEGALHVHVGDDAGGVDLLAVVEDDAGGAAVPDADALDAAAGADLAARGAEGGGERLGDRAHPAAGEAPGADVAVDVAHVVVEEDVGRAGRHRAERGADDRGDGEVGLDDGVLEILVEEVGDAHGPEADHLEDLGLGEGAELAAEIGELAEIARAEGGGVGRGAQQAAGG